MTDKTETSLGKHFLGILCIALLILIPTGPLVYWLIGEWALRVYAIVILPFPAIVGYMMYLSHLDDVDRRK